MVGKLRADGHQVVAVSRSGGRVHDVDVARLDILDAEAVARSARDCDGAFLVAGRVSRDPNDAEELHRLHVLGTRTTLKGLRGAGVHRCCLASTSGTMAVSTDPRQVSDETSPAPMALIARWPYYRSKLFAEREALEQNAPPDFEVVIVNPSLLLGPGDGHESSTGGIRLFLEGSILATPAGGIAVVDVRDAALGMVQAFFKGHPGERYILNAKNLSMKAFFARLERLTGVRAPFLSLPRSPELALSLSQLADRALSAIGGQSVVDSGSIEHSQYFWYCDATKAENDLGFVARDLGETLRDTIDDLVKRKAAFPRPGFRLASP